MTMIIEHDASPAPITGAYKVDPTRGSNHGRVSSEWFSRPADQRFLSLDALHASTSARAAASRATVYESASLRVDARPDNPQRLHLITEDGEQINPTHWSFGQLCSMVGAPSGYLRGLPAAIAGINLQYGLSTHPAELVKAYTCGDAGDGVSDLRAITSPEYGRIFDRDVVEAVQRIAGNGRGETRWKVPGVIDWGSGMYDPMAPVTSESTTLYASDRDVFVFLVDDRNPIEVGKLRDGSPDLMFRGFYAWNSEVGAKTAGIACMYLRAVCMNRNLWGVEGFNEIRVRHNKLAPDRFAADALPSLNSFAEGSTGKLLAGVKAAKGSIVATDDDERLAFLARFGFSRGASKTMIADAEKDEGSKPESVWDFVQAVTSYAKTKPHQDARLEVELTAKKMLDRVA